MLFFPNSVIRISGNVRHGLKIITEKVLMKLEELESGEKFIDKVEYKVIVLVQERA